MNNVEITLSEFAIAEVPPSKRKALREYAKLARIAARTRRLPGTWRSVYDTFKAYEAQQAPVGFNA